MRKQIGKTNVFARSASQRSLRRRGNLLLVLFFVCLLSSPMAYAAKDFNLKNNASSFFYVSGTSGNVGIGSVSAGQLLDVQGTVRMVGFAMTTSPVSGYVLTSDANGNGSWLANPAGGGWTASGSNVYTTTGSNNVGIGTSTPQGGFVVNNGNVGIGTWAPADLFQVAKYSSGSSGFEVDSNGNVGIGTTITSNASISVMNGNVGIGTWVPGSALQVNGNVGIGTFGTSTNPSLYFVNASSTGLAYSSGAKRHRSLPALSQCSGCWYWHYFYSQWNAICRQYRY